MRALIFAAGRGERMRPLTEHTPKPLLMAGGKPLVVWHLEKLAAVGVRDVVLNVSWLAECFEPALGDGSRWGLRLHYSFEGPEPLETGGGMLQALPLLGQEPFIVVNADVWTDYDFRLLPESLRGLCHLLLVDNPAQHPRGDFHLDAQGMLRVGQQPMLTYSGIGIYRPEILHDWRDIIGGRESSDARAVPRFKLAPLLHAAISNGRAEGSWHRGRWTDVGTPERLRNLDEQLA